MPYHVHTETINLEAVQKRIEATDLVPSRISLLSELNETLDRIYTQGIDNLTDLRKASKTPKKIRLLAQAAGVNEDYLVLLRREIESYFPKPFPLKSFDWLPQEDITTLEKTGINNTAIFYEKFIATDNNDDFKSSSHIKDEVFRQLSGLCDLTRMQWTSPIAARLLFEAGYNSVWKVSSADPGTLCNALVKINQGDKYFKGNIGLRDIKRLINSAGYLI